MLTYVLKKTYGGSMNRLQDKVAVVTGGGSGIGRAISLLFAEEGAHVVVISNVKPEVESVAKEVRDLGREGISYVVDVTDSAKVKAMADEIIQKFGRVDILVTAAGVMGARNFIINTSEEAWRKTIEINLNAGFYCIKAFLPQMMEQKSGRIIMISSASGKLPAAMNADYSASKHGVIGLTKALALELGVLGLGMITSNAICPGPIATPMMDAIIGQKLKPFFANESEEQIRARVTARGIQARMLDPKEVAYMAAYLASDEAKGITGQAMNVCGGTVLW
jgi:NAD(P)-dependent dehydrogenase (short-subunit alcohol dehydrogenase family)